MSAGTGPEMTDSKRIQIKIVLKNFINKFEKQNGNKKTLDLLKKVGFKLRKINEKYQNESYGSKNWYKRELYKFIGGEIYNLYLSKKDNTEQIVKIFAPGIYITQNKYGLGYTKIYAFGKLIHSENTLDRSFCNYYSIYDCEYKINNNYEISLDKITKIKERALSGIDFHNKGISNDLNIKIISIGFWEGIKSYILDLNNQQIIEGNFQNITHFKKGKSGYYFISELDGEPELFLVNKNGYIKKFFGFSTDDSSLLDYELLTNGRIKLFLSKWDGKKTIKFEKIINIK